MEDGARWIREIISAEITQRKEEGFDPSGLERDCNRVRDSGRLGDLEVLWRRFESLGPRPEFGYSEPSTLDEIRSASKGEIGEPTITDGDLDDRMLGAWLGRCAGCLLGKPVEGWSKERIEEYLRGEDAYPLDDYFPGPGDGGDGPGPTGIRGSIDCMPRDDDTDYTILGLHVLENHGKGANSEVIASEFLRRLPYYSVYTAERIAYMNLVNMVPIPKTATHLNPYREWIGAQIRADPWGYAYPGNPAMAAEMAFRDARISHVKNGIYGSMMVAAMVSRAFSTDDVGSIIDTGLSVIPGESRLHVAVDSLRGWASERDSWLDCWERVKVGYGNYSPVHTINNALIVVLALLFGEGNYSRSVCLAVMGGWDTDCNGATVGSILGAMGGAASIPSRWTQPLNDTVKSDVLGYRVSR